MSGNPHGGSPGTERVVALVQVVEVVVRVRHPVLLQVRLLYEAGLLVLAQLEELARFGVNRLLETLVGVVGRRRDLDVLSRALFGALALARGLVHLPLLRPLLNQFQVDHFVLAHSRFFQRQEDGVVGEWSSRVLLGNDSGLVRQLRFLE